MRALLIAAVILLSSCTIDGSNVISCNDTMADDSDLRGTPDSEGYVFFDDDRTVLTVLTWPDGRVMYLSTRDGCLIEDNSYYE